MKKILAIMLCALLLCAFPVVAYAQDTSVGTEDQVEPPVDVEQGDQTHEDTEDLGTPEDPAPDDPPYEKPDAQIEAEQTTEKIVQYVKEHLEEISVIITMILTVYYQVRKHASLNKSIGTLNNNAVTVAENSSSVVNRALSQLETVASEVGSFTAEIANLLREVRANDAEKKQLADALSSVDGHLKAAKLANIELSNEVAELLVLANIPNSKKEELYSRHRAAVDSITAAELPEVKEDVRKEA